MREVIEKGYTLAARSDVERILNEQRFQRSELTERQIAELGQILNVPAILIVSINTVSTERYQPVIGIQGRNYYYTSVSISARLISAELAEVLWISSYSGSISTGERSREAEGRALAPIARIVASGLPRKMSL